MFHYLKKLFYQERGQDLVAATVMVGPASTYPLIFSLINDRAGWAACSLAAGI